MENYEKRSLIGEGSFGRVYKATDKKNNKTVALKLIAKIGRTNKEIQNFREEFAIQHRLSHPYIIQILDSFETDKEIAIVTEFARSDLHKLLNREKSITEKRARRLTCQLVSALYYLHSHRILHRDLKPQNILVDGVDGDEYKLCDFGLARSMTEGTHVLTSIKGTPLYMAPEVLSGKPYKYLADLWSLGCIIYETMAGGRPFDAPCLIQLIKLIQEDNVKWPSFISNDCKSFLQGLLEKDPSNRLTWAAILQHPFVRGHIYIVNHPTPISPFTHSLSESQGIAMKRPQANKINPLAFNLRRPHAATELLTTSQDSINAILQSDIENLETDAEDAMSLYAVNKQQPPPFLNAGMMMPHHAAGYAFSDLCFVSGNSNMIVTNLNDNFQMQQQMSQTNRLAVAMATTTQSRNKDLEKRKLNQNLENFSVRLGGGAKGRTWLSGQRSDLGQSVDEKSVHGKESKELVIKNRSGSESGDKRNLESSSSSSSCEDLQNPPMENEEWMAFLQRSMQEVLKGELDTFKQKNLASIVVAPLRNSKASAQVIECVAQLLSLPLVVEVSAKEMLLIRSVYLEVKLVSNLVYASTLLCSVRSQDVVPKNANQSLPVYRQANQLTMSDRKTLLSLYELICHLVHLSEHQYLKQFCDAVEFLGASELLANLMVIVSEDGIAMRLTNCILALMCFALREQPEKAELVVERVMFHSNVSLLALLTHRNVMLKTRMCRMLRMLGRFSCCALQNVWTPAMNVALEALLNDPIDQIRNETERVIAEFEHFSFYKEMGCA